MKSDEEVHLEEWKKYKGYLEARLESVNNLITQAEAKRQ